MNERAVAGRTATTGREHWTRKGDVKLFLWQKPPAGGTPKRGTVLFVHGSSMGSQPTFDLHVPGRPDSSVMDWFAARGFDACCMDNEGYGPLRQAPPDQLRHPERRRRPRGRHALPPRDDRRGQPPGLRHLVRRAYAETVKVLQDPELQPSFRAAGVEASVIAPAEFGEFMRSEYEKWGKVVRATGATVN